MRYLTSSQPSKFPEIQKSIFLFWNRKRKKDVKIQGCAGRKYGKLRVEFDSFDLTMWQIMSSFKYSEGNEVPSFWRRRHFEETVRIWNCSSVECSRESGRDECKYYWAGVLVWVNFLLKQSLCCDNHYRAQRWSILKLSSFSGTQYSFQRLQKNQIA